MGQGMEVAHGSLEMLAEEGTTTMQQTHQTRPGPGAAFCCDVVTAGTHGTRRSCSLVWPLIRSRNLYRTGPF